MSANYELNARLLFAISWSKMTIVTSTSVTKYNVQGFRKGGVFCITSLLNVAEETSAEKLRGTFCPPNNTSHSSQSAHPLIALAHDSHYPVQLFREFISRT